MASNKVRQNMTIGVIGFEPTASSSRTKGQHDQKPRWRQWLQLRLNCLDSVGIQTKLETLKGIQ